MLIVQLVSSSVIGKKTTMQLDRGKFGLEYFLVGR